MPSRLECQALFQQYKFNQSRLTSLPDATLESLYETLKLRREVNRRVKNGWGFLAVMNFLFLPLPTTVFATTIYNILYLKDYIWEARQEATEREIFRRNTGLIVPSNTEAFGFSERFNPNPDVLALGNAFLEHRATFGTKLLLKEERADRVRRERGEKIFAAERKYTRWW